MKKDVKLGILDHTHVCEGRTVADTLAEAVELAREAERLGYARYWVSEHHGMASLASSSPEILTAHVAAATSRIRVGAGGVMLPHYSAYKVAENFRLLEALHPNRIDLGLGRAPGGLPLAPRALREGKFRDADPYPRQVDDLIGYLHESLPEGHRYAGLLASPSIPTAPEIWLLGSGDESARLAGEKGLAFSFAQFFGTPVGPAATRLYRESFRPSAMNREPRTMVAVLAVCADTEEEARRLAASHELFFLRVEHGFPLPWLPSVETAESYPYTAFELELLAARRANHVVGNPAQVREGLERIIHEYGADELMITCPIHDFGKRLRSIRLIREALE